MRDTFEKELRRGLIGTPLGFCRFLDPTFEFAKYMQTLDVDTVVFDVGAGAGHVTKFLTEANRKAIAIDMHEHAEQVTNVVMADGTDFPYIEGSVVMLCRPCHGGFTEQVIEQAIARKVGVVLYVGLERNVEDDLGDYLPRFTEVAVNVGAAGESIWRMDVAERVHQRLGATGSPEGTSRKARPARA